MATTNVNIRMDSELKRQFESFCSEVGLNMSIAFNMFAKKTVRDQRIPFRALDITDNKHIAVHFCCDSYDLRSDQKAQGRSKACLRTRKNKH